MNPTVREYGLSIAMGILAGALYWLMRVTPPAPPWVALTGLVGILAGEAGVRRLVSRRKGALSTDATAPEVRPPTA